MSEELEKEEQPETAPESARDTMQRVFEESQAQGDPGDENDAQPATTELENETPEQRADRQRDELGRFAKKESEPETALETGQDPTQGVTEDQPQAAPITAPLSWPGEMRKQWSKLPPEVRQYLATRDLETSQKLSTQGREVAALKEVMQQHAPDWEVRGFGPAEVLKQHIGWSKRLEANPVQAALDLASMYGVQPQQFAAYLQQGQGQQQQAPQQYVDPQYAQLDERFKSLEQKEAERQAAYEEHRKQEASGAVNAYFAETDPNGNLIRPYFLEVFEKLKPIVRSMREADPYAPHEELLATAYEIAISRTPDVKAKVEQDRNRERMARERQTVEQARRMGSSVRGAPNGAAGTPKSFGSGTDTVRAAYEGKIQ